MGFKMVLQEKQGLCGEMQVKDITQPLLTAFQCRHCIFILFDKDKASSACSGYVLIVADDVLISPGLFLKYIIISMEGFLALELKFHLMTE